jgi:hypothetical protein
MWGFEPIGTRVADKPIPYARRGDFVLAADVRIPDGMNVLILPAAAFIGTAGNSRLAMDRLQVLASGRFTDPHPPEWVEAIRAAGGLLAVIGPDDVPVLDAAKAREDPMRAASDLWVFKAAIAVLHLASPNPAESAS